jgi:GINS complex subunit 4
MVEEPDLDGAVFCKVVKDVEGRIARIPGTDAEFELRQGDVFVVRYSAVREFVLGGEVELI